MTAFRAGGASFGTEDWGRGVPFPVASLWRMGIGGVVLVEVETGGCGDRGGVGRWGVVNLWSLGIV